ncbi:GH36 C-terminal domain-containing protein [Streptomyces sp. NBC_00887]|uniref:GH36 C-terminal domain-containing protein n=1 Tax=Streptomyces sp. NBC_00887 TaxID=2975859 RepID=UPI00386374CC|nr:GH36 C-terminal domain-containing protein [Streptomyces sp. NBC_00887]
MERGAGLERELTEGATLVAQYKRVRHLVQHGITHRPRGPVDEGSAAVQYTAADRSEALLPVWQRAPRHGGPRPPLRLAGLDPTARYRDVRTGTVHSATVLGEYGLLPDLPPGDRASTAVHLVRTP